MKHNLMEIDYNQMNKSFKTILIKKIILFCELFLKMRKLDIFKPKVGSQTFLSFWNSGSAFSSLGPISMWLHNIGPMLSQLIDEVSRGSLLHFCSLFHLSPLTSYTDIKCCIPIVCWIFEVEYFQLVSVQSRNGKLADI
jgi:hypothetical protein